jgi:hypothetical protein
MAFRLVQSHHVDIKQYETKQYIINGIINDSIVSKQGTKEFIQHELRSNMQEIVIPLEAGKIPDFLKEFIERDPDFEPEIYSQNMENILIDMNMEQT